MKTKLLLLAILSAVTAFGQQSTVTNYLAAPISNAELQKLAISQRFVENNDFSSPWFRELDFRIKLGDNDPGIDEYRMRLGLINPLEIKANKDYSDLMKDYLAIESRVSINDALLRRYEILLENYFVSTRLNLLREKTNQLTKTAELSLDLESNLKDLIKLESIKTKLRFEVLDLEQKLQWTDDQIQNTCGRVINWGEVSLVDIETLLGNVINDNQTRSLSRIKNEKELALEQQLFRIDKAESFSNIGFIQGEYDISRGNTLGEHMGVQIGVQIPIFNTDKPKLQRKQLSMINEQVKVNLTDSTEEWQTKLIRAQIAKSQEELAIVKDERNQLDGFRLLTDQIATNIETLIELSDFEYMLSEKKLAIESNIYITSIRLVHLRSGLSQSGNITNYLDPDQVSSETE